MSWPAKNLTFEFILLGEGAEPKLNQKMIAENFIDRVKICYQEDGRHFEHLSKNVALLFMFQ